MKKIKVLYLLYALGVILLLSGCSFNSTNRVEDNTLPPLVPEKYNVTVVHSDSVVTLNEVLMFLGRKTPEGLRSIGSVVNSEKSFTIYSNNGQALLSVVNFAPCGYVIMPTNKDLPPVLAFSDEGNINPEKYTESTIGILIDKLKEYALNSELLPDSIRYRNQMQWLTLGIKEVPFMSLRSYDSNKDDEKIVSLMFEEKRRMEQEGFTVYFFNDYISNFPDNEFFINPDFYNGGTSYISFHEYLKQLCYRIGNNRYLGGAENSALIGIKKESFETYYGERIRTSWGQGSELEPESYGKYAPNKVAGCTAVAVGQLMYHNQYPTDIPWQDMELNHSTDATARFLKELGNPDNLNMRYVFAEPRNYSSSDIGKALRTFQNYGYRNVRIMSVDSNKNDLVKVMRNEKRPVYIQADDHETGHAWIFDLLKDNTYTNHIELRVLEDSPFLPQGYDIAYTGDNYQIFIDSYLHMNLGWGGLYNGYFTSIEGFPSDLKHNFKCIMGIAQP